MYLLYIMSSYSNKMNAFAGSIAENQGRVNNYLAEKKGVAVDNQQGYAGARAEAIAHTTGEFIKGAGFEGAIRAGKPVLGKALKWLDTKTGFSRKVDDLAGVGKKAVTKAVENKLGGVLGNASKATQNIDLPDVVNTASRGAVVRPPNASTRMGNFKMTGGKNQGQDYTDDNVGESKSSSIFKDGGDGFKSNVSTRGSLNIGDEEDALKQGASDLKSGLGDSISGLKNSASSLLEDGSEDLLQSGGKSLLASAAETAGSFLDVTGVGAIVGVPLQIAGLALEGAGIVEAGKTVVDWFKQDVLGDKPKVQYTAIPQPKQVATLAGIGAQATPTFSTTMDVPGGSGSW
jgi:hypothetical protein